MIKIIRYNDVSSKEIFHRVNTVPDVSAIVTEIIDNVRNYQDAALLEYCARFDNAQLDSLEVSKKEWGEACSRVDQSVLDMLGRAADNIRAYHSKQLRSGYSIEQGEDILLGQKIMPLERVGIYVPGGTACYPSTVLMNCIPAKLAQVKEVIMVSPAGNGQMNDVLLAAARVAGVDRIFKLGGAQAVAALAYGTESVPRVDKIVGPGNAFVAEAKRQVFGQVDIDMIAGPSEILVVADESCDATYVAADMLSQAEHDKLASAVLVTDSETLALKVAEELERQLQLLPREEIARASIENNGLIIIADNIEQGIDIANEIAPEHLELCLDNAVDYLDKIRHAGSVFLGKYCPEALGDYFSGTNHTLPTMGTARFSSPLSVDDFVKKFCYTYYSPNALNSVADDIALFANLEGLQAHAESVLVRCRKSRS